MSHREHNALDAKMQPSLAVLRDWPGLLTATPMEVQ